MGSVISRRRAASHRGSHGSLQGPNAGAPAASKRPKKFSYWDVRLMKQYLPSFVYYDTSTEQHRRVAAQHWDKVFKEGPARRPSSSSDDTPGAHKEAKHLNKAQSSNITELYDVFYAYLEEHGGDLKHVFRSSMHVRGRVLVHISAGMRTMLASDNITDKILALTKTHRRFGVKLEHYDCVGRGLLHAMERTSGENWSPEIDDAWRRMFSHSSVILIRMQKKDEHHNARAFARQAKERERLAKAGVGSASNLATAKSSGFSLDMRSRFTTAVSSVFSSGLSSKASKRDRESKHTTKSTRERGSIVHPGGDHIVALPTVGEQFTDLRDQ